MSAERLRAARAIFDELADLPTGARPDELARRCGGDAELRALVERLLAQHDQGVGDFLEKPAIGAAASGDAAADGFADDLPTRIGAYTIVRKIGEGGMGIVYEARQENPRRTVALKVIRPALASGSVQRRFAQEATVLGQLQHPGIACVYEAGVAEVETASGLRIRQPFFAMEFVRGEPLKAYVESRQLPLSERLELAAKICDAVQHAHQKGVVHRDLKPANILVVEERADGSTGGGSESVKADGTRSEGTRGHATGGGRGAGVQPKILDFGVARVTDADTTVMTQQTDIGQLLGTIPYMSPEQVAGDSRRIDTRSDVYALGVILYELLAGRLPLDVSRRSIAEAARVIREDEPSRLSSINVAYRGDIETIVAKAMDKDRERRYPTAAELAADIRRHLRDEPLVARAPSAMYRLTKFARRNRALVGGVCATFVALVIGLVAALNFAFAEARQRKIADDEKRYAIEQKAEAERQKTEAERQKALAEEQRAIAEKRFDDVRSLAKVMIFKVHDAVKDLPGSTPARKLIVDTGMKYLDELAAQNSSNETLLRDLTGSYKRLAEVIGDPASSNLGDIKGALETFRKSLAICEQLTKDHPENPEYASGLVTLYERIAAVQVGMGHSEDALKSYQDSQRVALENQKRFPGIDYIEWDVVQCAANIGRMHESYGRLEDALPLYEQYRDFLRGEAKKDPGSGNTLISLSVIEARIGGILQRMRKTDSAMKCYEEATRICRDIVSRVDSQGPNTGVQVRLANSLTDLGRMYSSMGRHEDAVAPLREALEIQTRLSEGDPTNVRARRGRAVAHQALGAAFMHGGKLDEAMKQFEMFRDVSLAIEQAFPDFAYSRHDVGLAWNDIGKTHFMGKSWANAAAAFRQSYSRLQKVQDKGPDVAMVRNDLIEPCAYAAQAVFNLFDDKTLPMDERLKYLRESHEWANRCLAQVERLRAAKMYNTGKQSIVDGLKGLTEEMRKEEAKHGVEAPASQPAEPEEPPMPTMLPASQPSSGK